MSPGKDRLIFQQFPEFFGSRNTPRESLMFFGFECENGWFKLIKKLCEQLKALKLRNFIVTQVKEKYGGLRFHYSGPSGSKTLIQKVATIVEEAEIKSLSTCEICGQVGQHGEAYMWVYVRCQNHQPDGFQPYRKIKSPKV